MKNKHDIWGGMFDFDRNGKTTLDEELIGLKFVGEALKRMKKPAKTFTARSPRKVQPPPPREDHSWESWLEEYWIAIFAALILMAIVIGIITL